MFRQEDALQRFNESAGSDPASMPIARGFDALFDFCSIAAAGAEPVDEDGDMLLYEWGTYDWGEGAAFEVCLTRQVIWDDEDRGLTIWQLRLVYRFDPPEVPPGHGKGTRWCANAESLREFREEVLRSDVLQAVQHLVPLSVAVSWDEQ